jgi:hypothetical protein
MEEAESLALLSCYTTGQTGSLAAARGSNWRIGVDRTGRGVSTADYQIVINPQESAHDRDGG